ncbi:MAG: hypothetical protein KF744_01765 [Taibaiella sp.]|nr:hypothetical protein [Taibaiella sp.]
MFRVVFGLLITLALLSCGERPAAVSSPPTHDSAGAIGQSKSDPDLEGLYTSAIEHYVAHALISLPDTVFINRHPDFPGINLPPVIAKTNIKLVDGDRTTTYFAGRDNVLLLNVMAWPEAEKAEFLIVTFRDLKPQHNAHLYLERTDSGYVLDSFGMEYPYGINRPA